jgi:hypothetical protein
VASITVHQICKLLRSVANELFIDDSLDKW